jgi:hypothetical protein
MSVWVSALCVCENKEKDDLIRWRMRLDWPSALFLFSFFSLSLSLSLCKYIIISVGQQTFNLFTVVPAIRKLEEK